MSTQEQATEQACPECDSTQVAIKPYDFGMCSETGYHDSGERYRCDACGAQGDVDDMHGAPIALGRTAPPESEVLKFQGPDLAGTGAGWNTAQFD